MTATPMAGNQCGGSEFLQTAATMVSVPGEDTNMVGEQDDETASSSTRRGVVARTER
jgi:hypothetical protein